MNKRTYLKKGDKLLLMREQHSLDEWKILGIVGEGGSSVCYQASCGAKVGRLKEFYPAAMAMGTGKQRSVILRRDQNGQLQPFSNSMKNSFQEMCKEFVSAYEKLENAKKADDQNEVLNNYIPPYEVLYGYDEKDDTAGSVYIWTPDDKKGQGFDVFLKEVRKNPGKQAEWKLYHILNTLLTLTDCVKALHTAGLLHLDLKPSNFLVPYTGGMELNTNTISLFDVNTLYDVESTVPKLAGTRGFCAPEVMRGRAENRSDIYSIGAILFQGAVVCEAAPDGMYQDEFYQRLEQFVSESELILASDVNNNVFLKYWLVTILKKCLAKRPADRYGSCEELMEDLEKAKTFLMPSVTKGKLGENRKIAVVEKETAIKDRPQWAFHQMLYQDPLYRRVKNGEPIEVLVIGAGNYGQRFIDICLQTGQMLNHELHITAFSAEPELDQKVYLQFRPALAEFVDVNGSLKGEKDHSYGTLYFEQCSFTSAEQNANIEKAEEILKKKKYHYIFVSLGDDELSECVAAAFVDSLRKMELKCSVYFAVQGEQKKEYCGGEPVYLNARITAKQIDLQLERMAFLTHTCWNGFDGDQKMLRKQFLQKYNYVSSLSYALSIFYKLKSIGIEADDLNKAADLFRSKTQTENGNRNHLFRQLTALEHRRWVLEKVTNGWSAPLDSNGELDLMGCVKRGSVKDHTAKHHPCIVRSTEDTPLLLPPYNTNENKVWDLPNPMDETLDELDRMSVELHRCFKKQRDNICKTAVLQRGNFAMLRKKLSHESHSVTEALQQYQLCLQDILEGSRTASEQYPYMEKKLMDALHQSVPSVREDTEMCLKQIRREFFSVIEYNLYRDYKRYDEVLIERIPFILTYQPYPNLGMPYSDDRGYLFELYRAAAVLKPKNITVFAYLDEKTKWDRFLERMDLAVELFKKRQIHCKISFIAVVTGHLAEVDDRADTISKGILGKVYVVKTAEDAIQKLQKAITGKKIDLFWKGTIFADEYERNWKEHLAEMGFSLERTAEHTRYLVSSAFLRCADIYHMLRKPLPESFYPEFSEEYLDLWEIRKKYGAEHWNELCRHLKAVTENNDLIAEGILKKEREHTLIYHFPNFGYQAIYMFLEQLKTNGLVNEDSYVSAYTSDTGKLEMTTTFALSELMDRIFVDPYILAEEKGLLLSVEDNRVTVKADQLRMDGLLLMEDEQYQILEELKTLHLLNGLQETDGVVSFVFSSSRVKRMLTDEDEILRTYVYYEIGRRNDFDDLLWTKNGCILTKGFELCFTEVGHTGGEMYALSEWLGKGRKLCVCETAVAADDVVLISMDNVGETIKNILESI